MFLRKTFEEFLILHSEAEPLPPPPPTKPDDPVPPATPARWSIDWRWLETAEDVP